MNLALEHKERLNKTTKLMQDNDVSALLITPGPNLRYLTGYKAKNLERLTCLVLQKDEVPRIVVPKLEKLAAIDSGLEEVGIEIITWEETESSYSKIKLHNSQGLVAVDSQMNASKILDFQKHFSNNKFIDAKVIMEPIRSKKSQYEIDQLVLAGKFIDIVHEQIPKIFELGDTERKLSQKIAHLITEAGHESVDFTIVATGQNSASPHHEPGDTLIDKGDVLVIDIGGTTPSGYCSDSTRTYVVGNCSQEFQAKYEILKQAQFLAIDSVRGKITAEDLDSVAREYLLKHDLGEYFIHRTGHGIGMETHEEPYIVRGNTIKLLEGNAFSIEPGFYIEGKYGARIEDIVVKNGLNTIVCNNTTKELVYI
jgi:Xaa-Pro aminopeptidase